ncbi:hypothetical protein GGS20DRAFT_582854 [Poronia punctata]|nr:hypothetical protein GGS20DRAFT_582854 [Poronia punctata]
MGLLESIFNHLVLPPNIPGSQDNDIDLVSREVLKRLIHAVKTVIKLAEDAPWKDAFQNLCISLETCLELNTCFLERTCLSNHLRGLVPGQMLILYVNEQNAGLLVRHETQGDEEYVIFESFEASAIASDVLRAGHAMQWDFPGRSAKITLDSFTEESFSDSLANFLEQATMESLHSLQASTKKAGVSVGEIRDTTDPSLISQMLISLLEAKGSTYEAPILRKRIRDDVNFTDSNLPWRRLPFWLVLRVAAQRHLCFALGPGKGQIAYKSLMATVLAELLDQSLGHINPHHIITLRSKLARRMAKLETCKERDELRLDAPCNHWITAVSLLVGDSITNASSRVQGLWDDFKRLSTRRVHALPDRAPKSSLQLGLPNSGTYLDKVLQSTAAREHAIGPVSLPRPLDHSIKQSRIFMDNAFSLAAMESAAREGVDDRLNKMSDTCLKVASQIDQLLEATKSEYQHNPAEQSAMVLGVFSLWVKLDRAAVSKCPQLTKYAPAFHPELLDVLQLPTKSAMEQLQGIQEYIAEREVKSTYSSILDISGRNRLAASFCKGIESLQQLEKTIRAASDLERQIKESEHKRLCSEYDEHTAGMVMNTCRCTWENGQHIVKGCKKCWHGRVRRRISIAVHEAFLPRDETARRNIIFELAIPEWLSAYRAATWRIFSGLAHPNRPKTIQKPAIDLQSCQPLKPYWSAKTSCLSLASKIKCFQQTHYKFSHGKSPLSQVILPFAANFRLYDAVSNIWVDDLKEPLTLEHLCGIQIPRILMPVCPENGKVHPPCWIDGPSSYEIQANQSLTPEEMSAQTFSAFQKILSGGRRRWPNLLVEMCSSNLNLSNEGTVQAICQLAVQAGPRLPGEPLRRFHEIFNDPMFTQRLTKTLRDMLDSIRTNWREHNTMQVLITLALRLHSLSPSSSAVEILISARKCLLEWIAQVQEKTRESTDGDEAQRFATYGIYAALLCRQTFSLLVDLETGFSQEELSEFIRATLALQENVLLDMNQLSSALQRFLLRDAKMAYHLDNHIKLAMRAFRSTVLSEITRGLDCAIPETGYGKWTFLPEPDHHWIVATTAGAHPQRLHFNYLGGHLLVNGKPRSKLPLDIAADKDVKAIFGNQHLITYPSRLPGMSHQLERRVKNHEVHFGLRDGRAIIRAIRNPHKYFAETLEFVPAQRFVGASNFDFPSELVRDCGHWLNVTTGNLEIRRGLPGTAEFWMKRKRDWFIDLTTRQAFRGEKRVTMLVDPGSETFVQIAEIFRDFEHSSRLTVYQPPTGKLTVELKHLDLRFSVNKRQRLECRQLEAEIDPDQDAGTWYGLSSKIVMRDIVTHDRSIIVPLGKPSFYRRFPHVHVRIEGTGGSYAQYKIDNVLGRLSCSPEPRLVQAKALYHALTSFCLKDPLTGRTGASEAIYILTSGTAQPWNTTNCDMLSHLSQLVPRREYYPPNLERLQKAEWESQLASSIQQDAYLPIIEAIKKRSNALAVFAGDPSLEVMVTGHLHRRGLDQRLIYDPLLGIESDCAFEGAVYTPRDRRTDSESIRVYQTARVIMSRCSQFHMTMSLKSVFGQSEYIGGFPAQTDESPVSCVMPLISQIEDPLHENWGELVDFCRRSTDTAELLFRLCLLAFSKSAHMDVIQSLAALSLVDTVKRVEPPRHSIFKGFNSRDKPPINILMGLISPTYPVFQAARDRKGRVLPTNSDRLTESEFYEICEQEAGTISKALQKLWPLAPHEVDFLFLTPEGMPEISDLRLLNSGCTWDTIRPEWQRRYANLELEDYLEDVDKWLAALSRTSQEPDTAKASKWERRMPQFVIPQRYQSHRCHIQDSVAKPGPDLEGIMSNRPVLVAAARVRHEAESTPTRQWPAELIELQKILSKFGESGDTLRQQYARDLGMSLSALGSSAQQGQVADEPFIPGVNEIDIEVVGLRQRLRNVWLAIMESFAAGDSRHRWLDAGAIRSISTPSDLLQLLRSTAPWKFHPKMKQALIHYGTAMTALQRLLRIRRAVWRNDSRTLGDELSSAGHENWDPLEVPDWLLLEIDSDILIRAEQVIVAKAMINSEGGNRVLQLNMGRGKTSCIIPMVEAVLADGDSLSRVIVPKALLLQTAQTIQSRLGGLVGRRVMFTPFSRRSSTKNQNLDLYEDLHREALRSRDLVLTSHENLLSYKLCGWQNLADQKKATATQMIRFQNWLEAHARDVLDECDYTLSVKTQLNYPSGAVLPVDFYPYRWQTIQQLLDLAMGRLHDLMRLDPKGLQLIYREASFPGVSFLRERTENTFHKLLANDLCSGRFILLRPVSRLSNEQRQLIQGIMCNKGISDKSLKRAANLFSNPKIARDVLLLVRGLLLHRILVLCLGKRWNVHYGLHRSRPPIAVPYEAKGKPSEEAEYGHPDVAILLTCLSFYYAGLTVEQFVEGLDNILHHSEDAAAQYEWWTSTCTELPKALAHWNVVNAEDKGQVEQLWKLLRGNRIVVNHYLNTFVFPRYARQFEVKLQACSWDIPLFSEEKPQWTRTTGFSGTNDNRLMLPLTIRQRDLPELEHTSAEVLSYLLQSRNRDFYVTADAYTPRWSERALLKHLGAQGIRLLIDVGAYISEMENQEVARTWLQVDKEATAAVYFGNDNRAWVHYRSNTKGDVPLLATPFADDLSDCVVFLDEAHTRGVDLKLPEQARGAVTLALKLTKDHAVQAAMRLRQLRTTQSICFYGPPEVDQSIRDFCDAGQKAAVNSSHVVSWLLEQTCQSIEDLRGLYIAQGIDFCKRTDAIWHNGERISNVVERGKILDVLRQPERQTLHQLYGPICDMPSPDSEESLASSHLQQFMDQLLISRKYQQDRSQTGAMEEVEIQRQVEHQVEQVRQVQKPKKFAALEFPGIHEDLVHFACTGVLRNKRQIFEQAFGFIGKTSIGRRFGVHETTTHLFVSHEFVNTIKMAKKSNDGDNFLRPVEFIVWAPVTGTALVVIPEEAEYFLEYLRGEGRDSPAVHLITYAAPVTKAMLCFNTLEFYTFPQLPADHPIPERIKIELGILAGRLYVDGSEWESVAAYVQGQDKDGNICSDRIADDPAAFLLEWLSLRRRAADVLHTPMGYICTGREMQHMSPSEMERGV